MSLDRFLTALHSAGLELYVEDILDALWLSSGGRSLSLFPQETGGPETPANPPVPQAGTDADTATRTTANDVGNAPVNDPPPSQHQDAPIYPSGRVEPELGMVKASPLAVPAGQALQQRLQLARALRPFRQRWPSRSAFELDERRTVETSAELGGTIYPVFRPVQEPWFDVELVLEDDPAIDL